MEASRGHQISGLRPMRGHVALGSAVLALLSGLLAATTTTTTGTRCGSTLAFWWAFGWRRWCMVSVRVVFRCDRR